MLRVWILLVWMLRALLLAARILARRILGAGTLGTWSLRARVSGNEMHIARVVWTLLQSSWMLAAGMPTFLMLRVWMLRTLLLAVSLASGILRAWTL